MAKLIEQPEQFKVELKDKWLDYYKQNCSWLRQLVNKSKYWIDDSLNYEEEELKELKIDENYNPCRPDSRFILGIISTLEPQVHTLLYYLVSLNDNPDSIIRSLGLDFDPEIELKKRPKKETQNTTEYLDQIREEIKT